MSVCRTPRYFGTRSGKDRGALTRPFAPLAVLVAVATWATFATSELAWAKKGGGGKQGGATFFYSVSMAGDLSVDGAFGEDCTIRVEPPLDWGQSFENGIRVVGPRPRICISNSLLQSGDVTLDGLVCLGGVIPCAQGSPNWGVLEVGVGPAGPYVSYSIGETDADTGKIRRYALQTIDPVTLDDPDGTWPAGSEDQLNPAQYMVTVPIGTRWSLVQTKPGNIDASLTSQVATYITITEFVP